MSAGYDVAVVGAGIIGLGAAFAAARRGKRVVVIDRATEPNGATVRNFGHLCIGAQTGLARDYAELSRPLWLRLAQDAGFWLQESGTLVVARHADELALLQAATEQGGLDILDADAVEQCAPVRRGVVFGGGWMRHDLQVDPRSAASAIRVHLAALGVRFQRRTAATEVSSGRLVTSRGRIYADQIVVAVGHDLDHLLPGLAESSSIVRCGLDMLRVLAGLDTPPVVPLLTGWSMLRYGRFASLPEAETVRARLHRERPDLAALDLNQMYTQLPDGSVLVGDTHRKGVDISPFQSEAAAALLLEEFAGLFGRTPHVTERWQGVYASGPEDFLVSEPEPGVVVLATTTGIGMTTGLGLAETVLAERLGAAEDIHREGTTDDPADT